MKSLFDRLIGRKDEGPQGGVFVTSSGGNSLLEFRSEADPEPLVRPLPPPTPVPLPMSFQAPATAPAPVARSFRMDRHKPERAYLPIAIFALLMATSAAILAFWWRESTTRAAERGAAAASIAAASTAGAPGAAGGAAAPGVPVARTGSIDITSDPVGALVTIDGTPRGRSPVVISDLTPGTHEVSIAANGTAFTRAVTVTAGGTSTVLATIVPARSDTGWVAIDMPFEAEILERGRLLGTTSSTRLALPPGWHDLELRNTGLGFRAPLGVQIVPGQTVRPAVNAPTGLVSVNATPWAEVLIDGRSVGTTPLANLPVPIGNHTIVLRHPQFGERKQSIHVTGSAPVRIGVALSE